MIENILQGPTLSPASQLNLAAMWPLNEAGSKAWEVGTRLI